LYALFGSANDAITASDVARTVDAVKLMGTAKRYWLQQKLYARAQLVSRKPVGHSRAGLLARHWPQLKSHDVVTDLEFHNNNNNNKYIYIDMNGYF